MKKLLVLLVAGWVNVCSAQPASDIPDAFQQRFSGHAYLNENLGQVSYTNGTLAPNVKFVSHGSSPKLYLQSNSLTTFQFNFPIDQQVYTGRIDMSPSGELATLVQPQAELLSPGVDNFYLAHCPAGITGVRRYPRVGYKQIFPFVDQVYYSTPNGIRTAIICRQGFDPLSVVYQFHGQDSLRVDVTGFIDLFVNGQHLRIPEAMAYQVDGQGNVLVLPWMGKWEEVNSTGLATILFENYDPTLPVVLQIGPPPMGGGGPQNLNEGLDWSTSIGEDVQLATYDCVTGAVCDPVTADLYLTGNHQYGELGLIPGYFQEEVDMNTWVSKIEYAPGVPELDAVVAWTTMIGGTANDFSKAIHLNNAGTALYVGGQTMSADISAFPESDPNDGTYWEGTLKGLSDGLLIRLSTTGGLVSKQVLFGGAGKDLITAFTEDGDGAIWFSGVTDSQTGAEDNCNSPATAFPLCNPPENNYWQPNNAGGTDAFLTCFDADFHMTLSTFYGSTGNDRAFDMAYLPAAADPARRIVLVGRAGTTIPQISIPGAFQQSGNAHKSGMIATFDGLGALVWSTNLQGLNSLQAATFRAGKLAVLGYTHRYFEDVLEQYDGSEPGSPSVALSCTPVAGSVSICDPGNNAYVDDAVLSGDLYYAEFAVVQGTLQYSTFIGGDNEENPTAAMDAVNVAVWDPFRHWRLLDLEADAQANMFILGTTANHSFGVTYPVQAASPFYYRETPPSTGWNQSDITLHCLLSDRTMWWRSTFGAWFNTIDPITDFEHVALGSDFGCDLALANGKALYWAGSTGNDQFPTQCPFPGTSYCEPFSAVNAGLAQGFATRMPLTGVSVGVEEMGGVGEPGVMCWPNPSDGTAFITLQGLPFDQGTAQCFDAAGRLVGSFHIVQGRIDLRTLEAGSYAVHVISRTGRPVGVVRITKTN